MNPGPAVSTVRTERLGTAGVVTLDRPRARNALDLAMIDALQAALDAFALDPSVVSVVLRSADEKAFCAGGDVRAVSEAVQAARRGEGDGALGRDFFRREYRLNHSIARYPKPYVALIDGVALGGGLGISVHGTHRVVTERASMGMPEMAIGLIPDVGGTYFLPRCPGELGTYLALTGARASAADALHTGLATSFVPSGNIPALLEAIAAASDERAVDEAVQDHATDAGVSQLEIARPRIDAWLAGDDMGSILERLSTADDVLAKSALSALAAASPTSLVVTLRLLREGRGRDLRACLVQEYRAVQGCLRGHDFHEGIRAVLVDKDRTPHFVPRTVAEVTADDVRRHLEVPPEGDLPEL
jgi:enoyl-CoA hydratase